MFSRSGQGIFYCLISVEHTVTYTNEQKYTIFVLMVSGNDLFAWFGEEMGSIMQKYNMCIQTVYIIIIVKQWTQAG